VLDRISRLIVVRRRPASKVKATSVFFGARFRGSRKLERENLKRSNRVTCSSFLDEAEFLESNINLTTSRQRPTAIWKAGSISYSWSKFRDALIMGNKEEAVRVWCTSSKQAELSGRALN
jgi:hypothetical protein